AIPDVIGDSGLLFRENDVEHLAAQIEQLLKNPELRRKLAQAGRQRILTHFTQKQVAEQTVAVYQDMMP
ncbi:MAG TPA: glycosyltransferase, partial [Aggregatilineales bacterium]|nr:glycosyltransferase [Aggregatilineales bacterium]